MGSKTGEIALICAEWKTIAMEFVAHMTAHFLMLKTRAAGASHTDLNINAFEKNVTAKQPKAKNDFVSVSGPLCVLFQICQQSAKTATKITKHSGHILKS
ncbi:hypothetical protein AMECASPLE_024451 [Ameca splendens]|uniref:Uncharacterized protein n=1 Tax=Ameca splendens TaxID=208324 RepID=A0ABV0ZZX5_9TELE